MEVLYGVIAAIVPTMAVYFMQRSIKKRDAVRKKADEERAECEFMLLESVNASIALSSATAIAIKRGHANGEVESALKYATEVKHRQRDFYQRKGIENIYDIG